jgi:Fe2+ or Zn2+ uptake regulation protein
MKTFDTVTEAVAALKQQGYVEDFNLKENCIECRNGQYQIFHNEFQVDEFYRFEGMTDPADETIVYAISSPRYKLKGVLVNGYGIYSQSITDEMVDKLKITNA